MNKTTKAKKTAKRPSSEERRLQKFITDLELRLEESGRRNMKLQEEVDGIRSQLSGYKLALERAAEVTKNKAHKIRAQHEKIWRLETALQELLKICQKDITALPEKIEVIYYASAEDLLCNKTTTIA